MYNLTVALSDPAVEQALVDFWMETQRLSPLYAQLFALLSKQMRTRCFLLY